MVPKLIVMLTYNDHTVANALQLFQECRGCSAQHWGFKDVGLPAGEMRALVDQMKEAGKTTFLEVVRYSEEECLESARMAVEYGFDYLMGTVFHESVRRRLEGTGVRYMPFCGRVSGSPSVLKGSIKEILEDGRRIAAHGVHGFDLLAYRHAHGEPLARAFLQCCNLPVVIAGSIGSFERLDRIKEIAPWGFTIGSAFFDGKFGEGLSFAGQIDRVTQYILK